MAQANTRKEVVIELDLTVVEAKFLRELVQNFLGGSPDSEPIESFQIRKDLFEVLDQEIRTL